MLIFNHKRLPLLAALFLLILTSCSNSSKDSPDSLVFEAMDTFMTIKSYGKNAHKANLLAKKEIENLEANLSTTNQNSEIYRINQVSEKALNNDGAPSALRFPLSKTTRDLTAFSLMMAEASGAAFNIFLYPVTKAWGFTTKEYKVPPDSLITSLLPLTDYKNAVLNGQELQITSGMQLDFGGIGKGFAGDKAIEVLKANGIESAILDLGGNIQLLGSKPDGSDWNIGLRNPWESTASPILSLKLSDSAIITSGGYERYFTGDDGKNYIHIFDSKTGRPVSNKLVSVTIICKEGRFGDALSTALFVMGRDKTLDFWRSFKECEFDFIMIFEDKTLLYTKPLSEKMTLLFEFSNVERAEK